MLKSLTKGKWSRPTDKSAVYLEFAPGQQWGVRVTLMEHDARVEAINGPRGVWYRAPERYSSLVRPPTLWERIRGLTLESKIIEAVKEKRLVAREENARLQSQRP
ncbi:MAG TPA: hypothetical protein GX521_01085 [Firmicutes bacterium]|nr:hypothetical protein [Bacillota bacterium]